MCGIMGFIKFDTRRNIPKRIYKVFTENFSDLQIRGTDATGYILSFKDKSIKMNKAPINADKFIKSDMWMSYEEFNEARFGLFHVRAATHGSKDNPVNNHPIVSRDEKIYLIHNGIISNYKFIYAKYGYIPVSETDSESIITVLRENWDIQDLSELSGSFAIAAYNKESDEIILGRHSSPLAIMIDNKRKVLYFASTLRFLEDLVKDDTFFGLKLSNSMEVPWNTFFRINLNKNRIWEEELKTNWSYYNYGYNYSYNLNKSKIKKELNDEDFNHRTLWDGEELIY